LRRVNGPGYDTQRAPYAVPVLPPASLGEGEDGQLPTPKPSETIKAFYEFVQNFRLGHQGWLYRFISPDACFSRV
jgi:DNA replication licensing factor MCM5